MRWWVDDQFATWKMLIDFGMEYRPSWEYPQMMEEVRKAHAMIPKVVGLDS